MLRGLLSVLGGACAAALLFSLGAAADEVHRSNWLPNVGDRYPDDGAQLPLGDMWTFRCPPGGSFSVRVDTRDDTDKGRSTIDPLLEVIDGEGRSVAYGDDDFRCSFRPVCGYRCPEVVGQDCGRGDQHSLIIRDFGTARATNSYCDGGGGYDLFLTVYDRRGRELSEISTELGGGAFKRLPRWVTSRLPAIGQIGPVLDDEDVPNHEDIAK